MDTSAFKTQSEIRNYKMPRINGNNQYKARTIIALDGGYSAVKGVSPDRVFKFPSYAKRAPEGLEVVGKVRPTDIQFRNDDTGEVWLVGDAAESLMDQTDIESTTDNSLYNRYRYDSEVFKVIMMSGMALGLWGTPEGNEIFLQTGLPAKYKDSDTGKLINALTGNHNISIKVGARDWVSFKFTLNEDQIDVMEQPQGTLCSTIYKDGKVTEQGTKILRANSIVLDIGFGTEDIFSVRNGYKNSHQTYVDTAMKSVFEEVIRIIREKYDTEVKIFELQKYLQTGEIPCFDQDTFKTTYVPFGDILEQANKSLCEKSVRRLMQDYGNMMDYQYLLVTGGTGESRFNCIKDRLSGLGRLEVIPGNLNTPDLPFSYSNVVGYYDIRHAKMMREMQQSEEAE